MRVAINITLDSLATITKESQSVNSSKYIKPGECRSRDSHDSTVGFILHLKDYPFRRLIGVDACSDPGDYQHGVYRAVTAESPKDIPSIIELASNDLKRLAAGSAAVLDLVDKNFIPTSTKTSLCPRSSSPRINLTDTDKNSFSILTEEYAMEDEALAEADDGSEVTDAEDEEDEVEEELTTH
ncbi:hypothetical protein BGZ80_009605 [Entomortierella chlamydospora]|uniref:Uncharacterized protein n=1 Tax=Entomortierella chlamydospora TaxID=101097 RepID=A0A9P6N475_9FUNG|nr:hypothetical protein BGZ80_009605 [Entomortierella chlamydospora]